jgi:NADH-quinone oxidoreductase subunit J
MTTRPRLKLGKHLLPGIVALALFAVMGAVFVTAEFGSPVGFPAEGSITAGIGFALFDLAELAAYETEGFLVSFLLIAVVLDAALDGAIMLAKREGDDGGVLTLPDSGGDD